MHPSNSPSSSSKQRHFYCSLKKSRMILAPSKLAIYEILAAKSIYYTTPSPAAKTTCQKILAGGVRSIPFDSNANLKALGYVLLVTMFHPT